MQTYKTNENLEKILLSQNFIETTSTRNKLKGKKSFKLSKNSSKEIYFDYDNLVVWNRSTGQDSKLALNEQELKVLLMYFQMNYADVKEILWFGKFQFGKAIEKIAHLNKELEDLKLFKSKKSRQIKIQRILDYYQNIQINITQ